jgi:hypothetical protein
MASKPALRSILTAANVISSQLKKAHPRRQPLDTFLSVDEQGGGANLCHIRNGSREPLARTIGQDARFAISLHC